MIYQNPLGLPVRFMCDDFVILHQPGNDEEWVTFSALTSREPSCGTYLSRKGVTAYHVISLVDDWFQSEILGAVLSLIPKGRSVKRIGFGASMGGFGAISFARHYKADSLIVGCPQVLIDPAEDTWPQWKTLLTRQPDARAGLNGAPIHALYDPDYSPDARHVAMLPAKQVIHHPMPGAGHEVFPAMIRQGNWVEWMSLRAEETKRRNILSNVATLFGIGRIAA